MIITYGQTTVVSMSKLSLYYNKCIKILFGFKKSNSVVHIILESGIRITEL